MPQTSLPVEYLFTITATTAAPVSFQNGPHGTRAIVGVSGGEFEGPKLKGTVSPHAGGDWVTVRPDGSFKLDVRLILHTDDGAAILMTYGGVGVPGEGGLALRTAPIFETADERYHWLNRVQAVATGTPARGSVTYEVYALQ